ncbi:MAG: hypothetical protein WBE18_01765, partial [Gammaproteobacteria bacterium]
SHAKRKTQSDLAKTRAQRWTQDQQQQQSGDASSASNNSPTTSSDGFWKNFLAGATDAIESDVKGVLSVASNPIQTAENFIQTAENLILGTVDPAAMAGIVKLLSLAEGIDIYNELGDEWNAYQSGDRAQRARILGATSARLGEIYASYAATRTGSLLDAVRFWGRGPSTTESIIDLSASNHINLLRLNYQLSIEEQQTLFNPIGGLSAGAIKNSRMIISGDDLENVTLINELSSRYGNLSDWGKYATDPIHTPANNFEIHFYHNSITGDVYYGMDYKAVLHGQSTWNIKPTPNFDYEPTQFNY